MYCDRPSGYSVYGDEDDGNCMMSKRCSLLGGKQQRATDDEFRAAALSCLVLHIHGNGVVGELDSPFNDFFVSPQKRECCITYIQ